MKIVIGCDHAGLDMKEELRGFIESMGHTVEDVGAFINDRDDFYPVYGKLAGEKVASGEADRGVLVCGTGVGMSLSANKVKGVRCVNCSEPYTAKMARIHNNANVVALGARVVGIDVARMITKIFLETEFESGGRHEERVRMIE